MPKYFEHCLAACSHPICARLREFENYENQYKFEISPNTKFEAVHEEMSKDIERLVQEKQELQEENDKLKGSNEDFRVQSQELSNTNGTLKQTVVELQSKLAKAVEEAKRDKASHQSTLKGLRKDHAKAVEEAKRDKVSHQSTLNELMKEHAIAEMKSDKEIERYRTKCEELEKSTVELEEHNRTLGECKLESEKTAEESAIKVKDLESQVQELNKELMDSENNLCTVREALQETKNIVEALKLEKKCSAEDKEWLDDKVSWHYLAVKEHMEQITYALHGDPGEIRKRSGSPIDPAQAIQAHDQLLIVECQDSHTTPAAPPDPPTPTSLTELKTTPAPRDDQKQEKANLPPKSAEIRPTQAESGFDRPPPLGPKRSMPQHAEGWRRGRPRRAYDSYRPGDPELDY